MRQLTIHAGDISRYLLARVVAKHGAPIVICGGQTQGPPIPNFVIQPGGIGAFKKLGVDVEQMLKKSQILDTYQVLSRKNKPLFSFDLKNSSAIVISQKLLLETISDGEDNFNPCSHGLRGDTFNKQQSPGILLFIIKGSLVPQYNVSALWKYTQEALVGLYPVDREQLMGCVVPTKGAKELLPKNSNIESFLSDTLLQLKDHLEVFTHIEWVSWFPIDFVGWQPCMERDILWWGSQSLRLHPLTGQQISYWAIRALALDSYLAKNTPPSNWREIVNEIDMNNRNMYERHCRMMNFLLKPTRFWELEHSIFSSGMRHFVWLRNYAQSQLTLL